MGRVCALLVVLLLVASGCAAPRSGPMLAMTGQDEAGAAHLLAGYLLARGWTVRLADETLVEASRGEQQLRLEALLDPGGLDRVVVERRWIAAAAADLPSLEALAVELNDRLNVGQFRAEPGALALQASLPFIRDLEPRLLDAFIAFTADVRLAVLQVQGERELLATVEEDVASR
jgi:hypothetical protein